MVFPFEVEVNRAEFYGLLLTLRKATPSQFKAVYQQQSLLKIIMCFLRDRFTDLQQAVAAACVAVKPQVYLVRNGWAFAAALNRNGPPPPP